MTATIYSWAPITKSEKQDDGTLLVYGPAATSALDRDRQRLDATWLDSAMPRWMSEGGGVREQHDSKRAVGVGVGLSKSADGAHMLTARIVDPIAVMKVEYGVLKGFSVGIKNPEIVMGKADAPNGLVTGGDVIEVSVCDRPSNPECMFQMAKSDTDGELALVEEPQVVEKNATYGLPQELFDRLATPVRKALADLAGAGAQVAADLAKTDTGEERTPVVVNVTVQAAAGPDLAKGYSAKEKREALAAGEAMPNAKGDPAYTIKTKADLRRAVKAVGRGGADHDSIRKHVIKRAKALGLEAMVPENWNADGSLKQEDAAKAEADPALVEKAEGVLREVRALVPDLVKADDDDEDETDDIAGAQAAIAAIAKLIVSEAESLAMGNLNEACDIALLLDAVRALKWFQQNERNEGDGVDVLILSDAAKDGAELLKADVPDLAKAGKKNPNLAPPFKKKDDKGKDGDGGADDADATDAPADAEDDDASDDADKPAPKKAPAKKTAAKADGGTAEGEQPITKAEAAAIVEAAVAAALAEDDAQQAPEDDEPQTVTKAELADLVKSAVAQARAAEEERTKALAADVAKASVAEAVKDLPQPGGPALTRTAMQQQQAVKSDADRLTAEANELLAKAEAASANRDLAQGYRDRARALLKAAA